MPILPAHSLVETKPSAGDDGRGVLVVSKPSRRHSRCYLMGDAVTHDTVDRVSHPMQSVEPRVVENRDKRCRRV